MWHLNGYKIVQMSRLINLFCFLHRQFLFLCIRKRLQSKSLFSNSLYVLSEKCLFFLLAAVFLLGKIEGDVKIPSNHPFVYLENEIVLLPHSLQLSFGCADNRYLRIYISVYGLWKRISVTAHVVIRLQFREIVSRKTESFSPDSSIFFVSKGR